MRRLGAWLSRLISKSRLSKVGSRWYRGSMRERIFAYGSNMCLERLRKYEVRPEQRGQPGQLQGYALRFNKRSTDGSGKANVEPHDGGMVWGVLYEISEDELQHLNSGEVGYSPVRRPVIGPSGPVEAWVHVAVLAPDDAALRPYSWYKRFLAEGARFHGLPPDYVGTLEAIDALEDPDRARDRRRRAIACDR